MARIRSGMLIACLLATTLVIAACGGPKIYSTSIDGAVRGITNWSVEWNSAGQSGDRLLQPVTGGLQSEYKDPARNLKFINETKEKLKDDFGFGFYVNMPIEGRLLIRPVASMRGWVPQGTGAGHWKDDIDGAGTSYDSGDPYDTYTQGSMRTEDGVRFVQVDMYDIDDRFLGSIFVSSASDEVKPKHVAKAIYRVLKEGGAIAK